MPSNFIDNSTTIDDKLGRIEELLESQLAQDGVTEVKRINPTPFEYATVPNAYDKLQICEGETTLDFENGRIVNQWEGEIGELRDFADMSQGIDSEIQSLRSLWVSVDGPMKIKLDDGQWFPVSPGTYHPLVSQGYRKATVKADRPAELYAVASTRAKPFTDSDSVHSNVFRRSDGRFADSTPDTWETAKFSTEELLVQNRRNWESSHAKGNVFTAPCEGSTWMARNTSDNANDIDVRILGGQTDQALRADSYHTELARATNISQGDTHVFNVDSRHKWMIAQVRNSTNGSTVDFNISMTGLV